MNGHRRCSQQESSGLSDTSARPTQHGTLCTSADDFTLDARLIYSESTRSFRLPLMHLHPISLTSSLRTSLCLSPASKLDADTLGALVECTDEFWSYLRFDGIIGDVAGPMISPSFVFRQPPSPPARDILYHHLLPSVCSDHNLANSSRDEPQA